MVLQYGWENCWSTFAIFSQPKKDISLNIAKTTIKHTQRKKLNAKKCS